jgi:hypothetical protein
MAGPIGRTTAIFERALGLPGLAEVLPAGEHDPETGISAPKDHRDPDRWKAPVPVRRHPRRSHPGLARSLTVPLSALEDGPATAATGSRATPTPGSTCPGTRISPTAGSARGGSATTAMSPGPAPAFPSSFPKTPMRRTRATAPPGAASGASCRPAAAASRSPSPPMPFRTTAPMVPGGSARAGSKPGRKPASPSSCRRTPISTGRAIAGSVTGGFSFRRVTDAS